MRTMDREPGSSGPLKYGPKRARMAALETARRGDRPENEPRAHTGPPDRRPAPPRHCEPAAQKLIKPMGSFEGDVAVKDLRERMALGPDLPLEPPVHKDGRSASGVVGHFRTFRRGAANLCQYPPDTGTATGGSCVAPTRSWRAAVRLDWLREPEPRWRSAAASRRGRLLGKS
jgi:hypothetical protein